MLAILAVDRQGKLRRNWPSDVWSGMVVGRTEREAVSRVIMRPDKSTVIFLPERLLLLGSLYARAQNTSLVSNQGSRVSGLETGGHKKYRKKECDRRREGVSFLFVHEAWLLSV